MFHHDCVSLEALSFMFTRRHILFPVHEAGPKFHIDFRTAQRSEWLALTCVHRIGLPVCLSGVQKTFMMVRGTVRVRSDYMWAGS
jgi:hypothetical protein